MQLERWILTGKHSKVSGGFTHLHLSSQASEKLLAYTDFKTGPGLCVGAGFGGPGSPASKPQSLCKQMKEMTASGGAEGRGAGGEGKGRPQGPWYWLCSCCLSHKQRGPAPHLAPPASSASSFKAVPTALGSNQEPGSFSRALHPSPLQPDLQRPPLRTPSFCNIITGGPVQTHL